MSQRTSFANSMRHIRRKPTPDELDGRGRRPNEPWHLNTLQRHLVAASGEFVGTFFFLFFGYAGHLMIIDQVDVDLNRTAAPIGTPGILQTVFVGYAYGFSLLVTVLAFYRISGGLFNPAVTLGLCAAGGLPWIRAVFLIPMQLIASMCAGGVVEAIFPGRIAGVNTLLGPNVNTAQGLFAEMFFTSYLVFVILMLAIEKSRVTFIAPIGIGLALFVAEIPGVYYTGGSLNPARSFGCAVAGRSFPGYHWIYWLGPAMGGLLAAGYYRFVKAAHYEEANPGQDAPVAEDEA
ncbi:aquaporin-like protein [Pestalotiopsis sp. NC0098]|nr:aquaporin-like protein [Pestalotiopsis sp. NC0098]